MRTALVMMIVGAMACGGSASSSTSPTTPSTPAPEQPVGEAAALLCEAPTRAEADPNWDQQEPAGKVEILANNLTDGVTNTRVLALVDGWRDKPQDVKLAELDQLIQEGNVSSCRLREVFTSPTGE